MASSAFIVGFFTALGWISAQKIVGTVDIATKPVVQLEQKQE